MPELARRSRLLSLLSEACELEHGLACSYLYAAFSLKRGQSEGLTFLQEQMVRKWASQISFVASQEMFHLAQAWNLLQAIGGTPYYLHRPFPQSRREDPIPVKLSLEGFSLPTIERFCRWERPEDLRAGVAAEQAPLTTVGAIYGEIAGLITALPEETLFIGDPRLQVGAEVAGFPYLVRVQDQASALAAVEVIRTQGEGSREDRHDCHYGVFEAIRKALVADPGMAPAVAVVANPVRREQPGATVVTDAGALALMEILDGLYDLVMRLLSWVFGPADPDDAYTRAALRVAISAMPVCLQPLGEMLMRVPSGIEGRNAGPSFSLSRHVPLPESAATTKQLVHERLGELGDDLKELAKTWPPKGADVLRGQAAKLEGLSASLDR